MTKFKANHPTGSSVLTVEASVARGAEGKVYVGFDNGYSYHHDWFDPEDAPAMMVAIAEAAGHKEQDLSEVGTAIRRLKVHIEAEEKKAREAEDYERMLGVAQELYERMSTSEAPYVPWEDTTRLRREHWVRIARTARDLLKEG